MTEMKLVILSATSKASELNENKDLCQKHSNRLKGAGPFQLFYKLVSLFFGLFSKVHNYKIQLQSHRILHKQHSDSKGTHRGTAIVKLTSRKRFSSVSLMLVSMLVLFFRLRP